MLAVGCPPPSTSTPVFTYTVVNTYPHDADAFTQGLVCDAGTLYEGTGLFGESSLRETTLETGNVTQQVNLDSSFFGEGIDVFGDTIVQLTWTNGVAFLYDKTTFASKGQHTYSGQGWGITNDGQRFIMSDGTSTIRFRDLDTFAELGSISVTDEGTAITQLNELEYIDGEIYANVWKTDRIAVIDPSTGNVTAWLDLAGLRPTENLSDGNAVLNGIAYDAAGDRLFVTGKNWAVLYEIELVAQ